jgi:hypothetical protein
MTGSGGVPPTILIDSIPADWLSPGLLVVGFLQIRLDGFSFRSLVPNPARAFTIVIEDVRHAVLSSTRSLEPRVFEVVLKDPRQDSIKFLVADPRACGLAIDHALAAYAARTMYR